MASSGLRKMLSLTISNTLDVLVFVHLIILQTLGMLQMTYHMCSGRWYGHCFMLADDMQILIMYDRGYAKVWQILWLLGYVDRCCAGGGRQMLWPSYVKLNWLMLCQVWQMEWLLI